MKRRRLRHLVIEGSNKFACGQPVSPRCYWVRHVEISTCPKCIKAVEQAPKRVVLSFPGDADLELK